MEKHKIIVPKGIRYIGEKDDDGNYRWKDFKLNICGEPYILNKSLTGCGYTEYCLTNDQPVILISPRRFLLENKEEQHKGDVYYFKNDNEVSIDYELDVEKDDLKAIQEKGKESEESKRKTLENLNILKENLKKAYLERDPKKPFKVLVTYDSFKHVKKALMDIPKDENESVFSDFFIVIDEFQSVFIDARFKSEAEITLLKELNGLKNYCYVSATPMLDRYLEMLSEFKDLPYYELDWASEDPGRVVKPKLEVKFTRSLNEEAKRVIDSYKNGRFDIRIDSDTKNIIESKEAVLFFNSVAGICQVIRTNRLHIDQVNVICAKTTKNRNALKRAFNDVLKKENPDARTFPKIPSDYEVIGKIPTKGKSHKEFTLCTRTVYLGADFYSTNARTFIFSDANIDCLSVDISMDLEQILGRQRLLVNPWKDSATIFIRTLAKDHVTSEATFKKKLNYKKGRTNSLLTSYYDKVDDPRLRRDLAVTYKRVADTYHYRDDYVSVSVEKDWETGEIISMTPEFNYLMMVSDMRAFDVQQVDYKDRFSVFSAIGKTDMEGFTPKSVGLANEFNSYGNTKDKLRLLVRISEDKSLTERDILSFLEMIPGKYKDYYLIVGPDRIKANSCREADIKKEWRKEITGGEVDDKVFSRMGDLFKVGKRYSKKGIKDMLKDLYEELEYKKTAKATDIDPVFITKSTKLLEDGKWVHGFEIIGKR